MWIFNTLIIAIAMYSKIPMPQAEWNEKNMRYAMCFFPVVGVVIGAAEFAAGYSLLHWLHCKPLLFSVANAPVCGSFNISSRLSRSA